MNSVLRSIMVESWREWHGDLDEDDIPQVNISFEEGFSAACEYLLPLLQQSLVHVSAIAEAGHLTDGFSKKKKNSHDILADEIRCLFT